MAAAFVPFAVLSIVAAMAENTAVVEMGYDVSSPQCGSPYPLGQAFGMVGVNGGLANDANPCLSSELSWALTSPGLRSPSQPAVSLYINTADPGPTRGVTDWPRAGSESGYGRCHGGWSEACAYIYGRARAEYSFALASAIDPAAAIRAPWWLDIETSDSWATTRERNYQALDRATIDGFIAGLRASGAKRSIGIYSFPREWTQITGLTARTAAAAFGGRSPPAWIGGSGSRKHAEKGCALRGFTGARPTLAQFSSGQYDADLRCS
jgi:hypothetical protein